MRKSITGHVGDPSFEEVLRLISRAPPRSTIFVHRGGSEKVFHFSDERAILLEVPDRDEPAPEGLEEGRRRLLDALAEAAAWKGALYEHREGPPADALQRHPRAVEIRHPTATLLEGLKEKLAEAGHRAAGAFEASPAVSGCGIDPLSRAEELQALVSGAFSKHLFLRELASVWRGLGARRCAAVCLKDLASHYLEWSAEENACEALEQALELCPADAGAAEELISLARSAGRQKQAERAAETALMELERLKLHERAVELYRRLERAPESAPLRRLGAEAMARSGDVQKGLKELASLAQLLESRKDVEGAVRALERIAELDPSNREARREIARVRRRGRIACRARRSATLLGGIALLAAWFAWDSRSAAALEALKSSGSSLEPRAELDLLRASAASFPATRHARRLADLEEELFRRSFADDRRAILAALSAAETGDLAGATRLLDGVQKRTLIGSLRDRARAALDETEARRRRTDGLLDEAARFLKAGDNEGAFRAYRGLLRGARDVILEASHSVPVKVETVPAGAFLRIDGGDAGRTPRWVLLPSDPASRLAVSSPGFETVEIAGPLGPLLERGSPFLQVSLVPRAAWASSRGGGEIALNVPPDAPVTPVLGADGVLRGFDARGSVRWESPIEADLRAEGPPFAAGPAVLLGTGKGRVLAFSVAAGKLAWSADLCPGGGAVRLGPVHGGQVVASSRAGTVLLNPLTGLVTRRLDIPAAGAPLLQAAVGDLALFVLEGGSLVCADLLSGRREAAREGLFADAGWVLASGGVLVAARKGGRLTGHAADGSSKLWEAALPAEDASHCAALPGGLVLGSTLGAVTCLDARTGQPRWKTSLGGAVSAIWGADRDDEGGAIVARIERGAQVAFAAVSAADGRLLWLLETGASESASARIEKDRVAVSTPSLGVRVVKTPDP